MKYYKIIQGNTCIGVINSNNFIAYQPNTFSFKSADEVTGDLIEYKNQFYREGWMKPLTSGINLNFINANIIEISLEEYNIFKEALEKNEIIEIPPEREPEYIQPYVEPPEEGLDFIRSSKIKEMSYECNKTIENGFDVELQEKIHHFSLTVQDQLNLITLSTMAAQGIEQIPYHADGELCKFYTPAEINAIVNQATIWKTYHTTYFNALKAYINSLQTIEEIGAITYGIELPEEFKTDVLRALEQ